LNNKKTYLIDLSFFNKKKISGIERYTLNLIDILIDLSINNKLNLIILASNDLDIKKGNYRIIRLSNSIYLNTIIKIFIINFFKFNFYIEAGFPILILLKKISIIRVLHDDFFEARNKTNGFKEKYIISKFEKFFLNKYFKIITVSNSSKQRISRLSNCEIQILPNTISKNFKKNKDLNTKLKFKNKKLLCVGTINERKNFEFAIRIFNILKKSDTQIKLEIIGRLGWNCKLFLNEINRSPYKQDIKVKHDVNDEGLINYYSDSSILLIPSHDEGFCLPFVEAQFFGTPVIAHSISIFEEIGGNSMISLPLIEENWVEAVLRILNDENIYQELSIKSLNNAHKFNYQSFTNKVNEIF